MSVKGRSKPMAKKIGILAYGSVIDDPGAEIEAATTEKIEGVLSPFKIEYARSSAKRGGAPTLVPVDNGGAAVRGTIFVVDVTEDDAASMLYRREINKIGTGRRYKPPQPVTEKTAIIKRLERLAGVDVVFYTWFMATIVPLTAQNLAALAIASVAQSDPGRDGISYLINAKSCGIRTALSDAYEAEIKRALGVDNLEAALAAAREKP